MSCDERQQQLERIAVERGIDAVAREQREHLEACGDCASHVALLRQLLGDARAAETEPLPHRLRMSVLERSARALRATRSSPILRWDLAAPLAVALLALPVAVGQGWLWTHGLSALLEPWLPTSVLTGLTIFYAASAALTLGALYGSLPLVIAYAKRNRLEAT